MMDLSTLNPFGDEIHEPFDWRESERALLLVHGFPGTPAEMRPLASQLRRKGWSTRALLLPGFGSDIASLPERKAEEWIAATVSALNRLRQDHKVAGLVGFSMGAAVAINAALEADPDSLTLIAPFWRLGNTFQEAFWPLITRIFPSIRPYKDVDFSSPKDLATVEHFLGPIDVNDSRLLESIRQFEIPTTLLNELRRIGKLAYAGAPQLATNTLVLQGKDDSVCPPRLTRTLVERMGVIARHNEIEGDHNLLHAASPVLAHIARTIDEFARSRPARSVSPSASVAHHG